MTSGSIAVILSGFPRLSETFALPELLALQASGALGPLLALKGGDGAPCQPAAAKLADVVERVPEGSDREREGWVAQRIARSRAVAIHAYFAHEPARVAESAASRLGLPFGFSAHAKDVRKPTPIALQARVHAARCVVACNPDVACTLEAAGANVDLIPHGVDTEQFTPRRAMPSDRLRILAVGRLVEKKGFASLVSACGTIGEDFSLRFVGGGPLEAELRRQVCALGLERRVTFAGICTHAALPDEFAACDVVAVPSIVDPSGDRDGLPNVLLEAMSSGRAIVGTRAGAIVSALRDGFNGLLVDPGEPAQLAAALVRLRDPALRQMLAENARQTAVDRFDVRVRSRAFAEVLIKRYRLDA